MQQSIISNMIKLKLDEIAQRLGKNSSEIAREAEINRNTINALMHNKVDGLKFSTIDKLCETYGLKLTDLVDYVPEGIGDQMPLFIYHQQTMSTPFYIWSILMNTNRFPKEYFNTSFDVMYVYIKDKQTEVYWDAQQMDRVAQEAYERYGNVLHFERLYRVFERSVRDVEKFYNSIDATALGEFSNKELLDYFKQVHNACLRMYGYCFFTEAYYAGFDRREIQRITEKYKLSQEDVLVLLAPEELTYDEERRLALLSLLLPYKDKRKFDALSFVKEDENYLAFVREFLYGEMDYTGRRKITDEDRAQEVIKYLENKKVFDEQYMRLADYAKEQKKRITEVYRKYGLNQNPLWFFNRVAFWREARKRAVLMGVYVLDQILSALEEKTGVSKKYLQYLSYEEFDGMLKGLVSTEILKERHDKGLLIEVRGLDYTLAIGQEADAVRSELDSRISGKVPIMLYGNMVSRGFARGFAKIIKTQRDAENLKKGEVAVLGQDVLLPLVIDKAGAVILTQEKISKAVEHQIRNHEVPSITGVKHALDKINQGDVIEVRANHRTVRILK